MKYIKTYENTQIYNIGDYVLLNDKKEFGWTIYLTVKIINVETTHTFRWYTFLAIDKTTNEILTLDYNEYNTIERKLTQDEINDFEAKKDAIKYNL